MYKKEIFFFFGIKETPPPSFSIPPSLYHGNAETLQNRGDEKSSVRILAKSSSLSNANLFKSLHISSPQLPDAKSGYRKTNIQYIHTALHLLEVKSFVMLSYFFFFVCFWM
jgi:hypothetical protein